MIPDKPKNKFTRALKLVLLQDAVYRCSSAGGWAVRLKLKDLMSSRSRLVAQLHSTKNYIKEMQCTNDKAHKAALDGIKKIFCKVEELINKIIRDDQAIYNNYQLIKFVPGIGHLTAVYIICCTNYFVNKVSGKQLASYAGVVPFEHSSGISIKGKNRVHKMANKT